MTVDAAIRARLSPGFAVDVRLMIPPGITMLVGRSGAGKTTVLRCLAGLRAPDEGRIAIGSEVVFDSADGIDVPARRRRLGCVFQDLALFPHLTVRENIEYGIEDVGREARRARAESIAASFRIAAFLDRRPGEISGGERQRVALARALVTNPRGLLLDEPLSALDRQTRSRIVADLREWNERNALPILYVTHAPGEVLELGTRVVLLEEGIVAGRGSPDDLVDDAIEDPTSWFLPFANMFDATIVERRPDLGTMRCRLANSSVDLEVPIHAAEAGAAVRIGVRAGDILLATTSPVGLSARNVIPGRVAAVRRERSTLVVTVDAGAPFEVYVTPGSGEALNLVTGTPVWLVIKTHSCRVVVPAAAGARRETGDT